MLQAILNINLSCILTVLDAIRSPSILFVTGSLILVPLMVKLVTEPPLHLLPASSAYSPYLDILISGRHDTGGIRFLSHKFMICLAIFAIIAPPAMAMDSGIMLDALSMIGLKSTASCLKFQVLKIVVLRNSMIGLKSTTSCLGALPVSNEHAACSFNSAPADGLTCFFLVRALSVWYDGALPDLNPDASIPTNNFLILAGSMNEDAILYSRVLLIPEANFWSVV